LEKSRAGRNREPAEEKERTKKLLGCAHCRGEKQKRKKGKKHNPELPKGRDRLGEANTKKKTAEKVKKGEGDRELTNGVVDNEGSGSSKGGKGPAKRDEKERVRYRMGKKTRS